MIPQEKAKELVGKFKYNTRAFNETNGWEDTIFNAKQCALIAVDEIISEIEPSVSMDVIEARIKYWKQVKQQIEQL